MTPDDIGLCTLADVRELMGTPANIHTRDDRVEDLIIRASAMVMNHTLREFAPGGAYGDGSTRSGTRTFLLEDNDRGPLRISFEGVDLDKLAEVEVSALNDDGDATVVKAMLIGRRGEPVYTAARLAMPSTHTYGLQITADLWGWPFVPDDVREATAMTVAHIMTSFPAAGRGDPMALQPTWEPRNFPKSAYMILSRYKLGG